MITHIEQLKQRDYIANWEIGRSSSVWEHMNWNECSLWCKYDPPISYHMITNAALLPSAHLLSPFIIVSFALNHKYSVSKLTISSQVFCLLMIKRVRSFIFFPLFLCLLSLLSKCFQIICNNCNYKFNHLNNCLIFLDSE